MSKLCPCCGTDTHYVFNKQVLGKHSARYVECDSCQTLFVESPTWLDEAYADPARDDRLDSGASWRNQTAARFLLELRLPNTPWIDFGCGRGLLKGFLPKQVVVDHDPQRGIYGDLSQDYVAVISLEVLEHQVEPLLFLSGLTRVLSDGGTIVLSTTLRDPKRHGSQWDYLALEGGQHVFFPTKPGLVHLASQVGLIVVSTTTFEHNLQLHILKRPST